MKTKVIRKEALGNRRFNWRQKEFTLSTFSCAATDMKKAIKNFKDAGFNMLELGWASHERAWEAVEECEKNGINLIFQDFELMGGMMHRYLDRKVEEETIRDVALKLKDKKYTAGYYVWDEPWRPDMIAEARRQSDILKKYDPSALLFSCFPPSYNPGPVWQDGSYPKAMEYYIQNMEPPVLSFDYYPIGDCFKLYPNWTYKKEYQLDDSILWCDLGLARKLAAKYEIPFWFYYQGCPLFEVTESLDFSMMRMMVYAAVLYGAKGVQQYAMKTWPEWGRCTGEYVVDHNGEKGIYFEQQKELHSELSKLGPTLMALESTAVYHSGDICVPDGYQKGFTENNQTWEDSEFINEKLPKRISAGEFRDPEGNKYILILNRDFYQPADFTLGLKRPMNVYRVSRITGNQVLLNENTEKLSVRLESGDAVLFRMQEASEEKCLIRYEIND